MRQLLILSSALLIGACSSEPVGEINTAPTTTTTATADEVESNDPATTDAPTTSSTSAPAPTVPLGRLELSLEEVVTLRRPVAMATHPTSGERYFVEKDGTIENFDSGDLVLDIRGSVTLGNEQGLLGMAFDPTGSALFINYTDRGGDTVVDRFDVVDGVADASTAQEIITVRQSRGNHNGGHLAFGPDGYLYIGLGDGGGGGDPERDAQNTNTLLGSMLRIAPTTDGYEIPPDNPFANGDGGAPEVFMYGLRNPWRYSFDPANGDLWIGDVGQDRFEEVDVLRAAEGGGNGANLGWNQTEGSETYRQGVRPDNQTDPIVSYALANDRCSVTGGEVYRGSDIPSLVGTYVFGDFCTGELFAIDASVGGSSEVIELDIPRVRELASFGIDANGELYAISLSGPVYRITRS